MDRHRTDTPAGDNAIQTATTGPEGSAVLPARWRFAWFDVAVRQPFDKGVDLIPLPTRNRVVVEASPPTYRYRLLRSVNPASGLTAQREEMRRLNASS